MRGIRVESTLQNPAGEKQPPLGRFSAHCVGGRAAWNVNRIPLGGLFSPSRSQFPHQGLIKPNVVRRNNISKAQAFSWHTQLTHGETPAWWSPPVLTECAWEGSAEVTRGASSQLAGKSHTVSSPDCPQGWPNTRCILQDTG